MLLHYVIMFLCCYVKLTCYVVRDTSYTVEMQHNVTCLFLFLMFIVCVSIRQQDVVQKGGGEEDVQQRAAERPVGEESSKHRRPEQTGGSMEGEKFKSVRRRDVSDVFASQS